MFIKVCAAISIICVCIKTDADVNNNTHMLWALGAFEHILVHNISPHSSTDSY